MANSFKVITNGRTGNSFQLERGIQQRDPFCLHISITCAGYLDRYLHFTANQKKYGLVLN